MIRLLLVAVVLLLASWAVLVLLARRLPQGAAKDLASVLPACSGAPSCTSRKKKSGLGLPIGSSTLTSIRWPGIASGPAAEGPAADGCG